jgi:hypothetical protein
MSGVAFFLCVLPLWAWFWRKETVNFVSDCIAEGIRKAEKGQHNG